jgi:hypothetical protein
MHENGTKELNMFAATAGGGAMGMVFREKPANKNVKQSTERKLAPARSRSRKSRTRVA